MKIIELNIGLSSKTIGELNANIVLNSLTGRRFKLISYRVQTSTCKDGIERCLAVKCEAPDDWQVQLRVLSDRLGQECVAIVGFIGHSPYDAFVPSLWVEPSKEETPLVDGYTLESFKTYLRDTIIPDSLEAGYVGYAQDLSIALRFLEAK